MLRTRSRASAAGGLLLILAPLGHAGAQDGRPPLPDTASPRAGVTAAPAFARALGALPGPYVSSDGRFVVLMATAPTARALDANLVRTLGAGCTQRGIAAEFPAERGAESLALDGRFLVVVVSGAPRATDACRVEWNVSPASIWRAAWMPPADGDVSAARMPMAARLHVDGAPIEPAMAYSRPSYLRTGQGWHRDGAQLRYYYDMSVLRPRADGRPHDLSLQIWDRARAPVRVDVDPAAASRLELELLEWTLVTTPSTEPAPRLALSPSSPVVPDVARALDTARTDLIAGAIRAAAWAAANDHARMHSGAVARLVAAEALFATREPLLAQGVVAGVQREHPCLVPPAGSSTALAELTRASRASARCQPVAPLRAAMLSIVPGLGNLAVDDRKTAALGATMVVGTLVRALMFDSQSRSLFTDYTNDRNPTQAKFLYERANEVRGQRNITLGVAAGFWVLDAISAAHGASVHGARIAHDRF